MPSIFLFLPLTHPHIFKFRFTLLQFLCSFQHFIFHWPDLLYNKRNNFPGYFYFVSQVITFSFKFLVIFDYSRRAMLEQIKRLTNNRDLFIEWANHKNSPSFVLTNVNHQLLITVSFILDFRFHIFFCNKLVVKFKIDILILWKEDKKRKYCFGGKYY